MQTHLIILNRATPLEYGADALPKRIHIVPRGELPNREAGLVQVLDDAALESIFADLTQNKAARGGLYLGEEHFIYNDEKSSEAFAWAKEFEKDAAGIWAVNPEYTDVGAAAIRNKRFKWTSFVADRQDTQDLGNGRVRILKLDTVGFTNQANGKGLLTPIVNRQPPEGGTPNTFADASASAANHQPPTKGSMKNIATKLGLAAEASEEAILGAVTTLQNRCTELEPLAAENTNLKNRLAALDGEQVDALLAERKLSDEKLVNRLRPVLLNLKNREDRIAFLDDCQFTGETKHAAAPGRILNRADLKTDRKDARLEEKATADKIKNRAAELQKGGLRFEVAYEQATRDVLEAS